MKLFDDKDIQKYIWDYFQMHSSQRMLVFNFYIVLSSLMITGIVSTFQAKTNMHLIGSILGFLLTYISFIFWKLDERTKYLIKHSEEALKHIESKFSVDCNQGKPHLLQLFIREEFLTNEIRKNKNNNILQKQYSYSNNLRSIFLLFGISGFAGMIISIILYI